MASIQGSINQAIGVGAALAKVRGMTAGKSPQEQATQRAQESVKNAVEAKSNQRRRFKDYLRQVTLGPGKTVGDLEQDAQKALAATYTPGQRRALMDKIDKGARSGKH